MSKRIALACAVIAMTIPISYVLSRRSADDSVTLRQRQPTPAEAIAILKDGNRRFVTNRRTFPRLNKARIVETALAQTPFATFLACSDSRVPVENLFDVGIGDLFVVRVAGNVCSDHEIGSIEYGVEHLQTPLVVVMGHTHCGAVTAVVEDAEVRGKFPHLAEHIVPSHEKAHALHSNADAKTVLAVAVKLNVQRAISDLLRLSEGVRELHEAGKIQVVGAVYDITAGTVEWLPDSLSEEKAQTGEHSTQVEGSIE
jgi:carbonic anhydrase